MLAHYSYYDNYFVVTIIALCNSKIKSFIKMFVSMEISSSRYHPHFPQYSNPHIKENLATIFVMFYNQNASKSLTRIVSGTQNLAFDWLTFDRHQKRVAGQPFLPTVLWKHAASQTVCKSNLV